MIDKSKTYKTRDGREVRIYATDGGDNFPVHGAWEHAGMWTPESWTKDGYCCDEAYGTDSDLIEVRPRHKRTVWISVFSDWVLSHNTLSDAQSATPKGRIACIKVELDFEEGEGL